MVAKFNSLVTGSKKTPRQYRTIGNGNSYAVELGFYLCGVIEQSKICPMVAELLHLEVGVHGCRNTNRN